MSTILEVEMARVAGKVVFAVTKQDESIRRQKYDGPKEFQASNGIMITSRAKPEIVITYKSIVCIRGTYSEDDESITIGKDNISLSDYNKLVADVMLAVEEFNANGDFDNPMPEIYLEAHERWRYAARYRDGEMFLFENDPTYYNESFWDAGEGLKARVDHIFTEEQLEPLTEMAAKDSLHKIIR